MFCYEKKKFFFSNINENVESLKIYDKYILCFLFVIILMQFIQPTKNSSNMPRDRYIYFGRLVHSKAYCSSLKTTSHQRLYIYFLRRY